MKHFTFAIASIIDANTGFWPSHGGGKIDHRAAEQHARAVRAKSIIALFAAIKQRIGIAVEAYSVRVQARRDLQTLQNLNDHMLKDIGLTRGDLASVQYGVSIIALFAAIKQRIGIAVEAYSVRVQARRDLQTLQNLNDRMLKDIGLTRGDLASVQYGVVTLQQLDAERMALRQVTDRHVTTSIRVEKVNQAQEAVNQEFYAEEKCA